MYQMYIPCYNVSEMNDVHPHFHPVASHIVPAFSSWSKKQHIPPALCFYPTRRCEPEGKSELLTFLPRGKSIAH